MTETRARCVRWAVRCIGFIIFAYLLHRIGPDKLWNAISTLRPVYVAAALPIFFIMIWVKTVKMRILMRTPIRLGGLYGLNAFAFSVGSLTPGRLGEFAKIAFLSKSGVAVSESFAVTLIDRISDVGIMILCALGGLYVFFGAAAGWTGLAVVLLLAAGSIVLWYSDRMLLKITAGKWRELVEREGRAVRSYVQGVSWKIWGCTMVLTLAYLGLYFLQMWILARGLSLPITYVQAAMAISCAALPAILPISIGNIGPRDAVLAAIFARLGWGAESGVAFSTVILALFLANGIFGVMFVPKKEPTP